MMRSNRSFVLALVLLGACSDAVAPPKSVPTINLAPQLDIGVQRQVGIEGATVVGWRTSDPTQATVGDNGMLRVFKSGPVTVTALLEGGDSLVAHTEVTVPTSVPEVLHSIVFPKTTIGLGETMRADPRMFDSSGVAIPAAATQRFVLWGSTGASIIVNDSGDVSTQGGGGKACVIGIINGMARCTEVTSLAAGDSASVGRLTLAGPLDTLVVGDTFPMQGIYLDAEGVEQEVPIVWGSHSPNTARVTLTGEVIALNPGNVTISGIAVGGAARMWQVHVKARPE